MNINNYAPKHINYEAALAAAPKYKGTFSELYSLVKAGLVTLVTARDGNVTGIYVESGSGDVMTDELAGKNFSSAYCCKPVMKWTELIIDAKYHGKEITEIDDAAGTCKVAGELVKVNTGCPVRESAPRTESVNDELPSEVEIDADELDEISLREVRNYLKREYGHCLARGVQPEIEEDDGIVYVTGIEWGRKLSDSEMDLLD